MKIININIVCHGYYNIIHKYWKIDTFYTEKNTININYFVVFAM